MVLEMRLLEMRLVGCRRAFAPQQFLQALLLFLALVDDKLQSVYLRLRAAKLVDANHCQLPQKYFDAF